MKKLRSRRTRNASTRPFQLESLEDRRMLAITVDTTADVVAADGLTSLREAIVTANSSVRNEIDFDASLAGETIQLNSQLFITDTLTIDASALSGKIVIDAQQNSRVFDVSGFGVDFTLRGLFVTNGEIADVGGGIRFDSGGDLTLFDTVVSNNRTTGNNNPGGGIYTVNGDITLVRSTVSENSTTGDGSDGGGIRTRLGDVTLTRSTVSENSTSGDNADGGGIRSSGGTINATNSTISGNRVSGTDSTGGGIHSVSGTVVIDQSTVTANTGNSGVVGAGISMDPDNTSLFESLTVQNSIVAGNTIFGAASDFLAPAGNGTPLVVTNSLIGGNLGTTLSVAETADLNGNLVGSSTTPIDAVLGPLAYNGGATATHSLLRGSPALDAGDPAVLANPSISDQRGAGFQRVINGRIDMGAFEMDHVVVNDISSDIDDGLPDNGVTTLREAINLANLRDSHQLITFDASLSGQTIGLLNELVISEDTTIDATSLESGITIDAQGFSRIFDVDVSLNLTIAGLTLTGGQSSGSGGAINFDSFGELIVEDSTITGNLAAGDGGGIYSRGDMNLVRSDVTLNTSLGSGGGIYSRTINISDSTIAENSASLNGGGISYEYGGNQITNTTVSGNSAGQHGGGIYSNGSIGSITNSTISGNVATMDGGGIHSNLLTYLEYSTVTANTAGGAGGGFLNDGLTLRVVGSIVSGNDANGIPNNLVGRFSGGGYNVLGDGEITGANDLTGINDPMLGPLADNGGPTMTHVPLPGSPALDGGDPAAVPGVSIVPEFDQRGSMFTRVFGSSIDIGSVEAQASPSSCDFNGDLLCDGSDIDQLVVEIASGNHGSAFDLTGDALVDRNDRDAWLAQAGAMNLPSGNAYMLGDANLDGAVDVSDFNVWNSNKFTLANAWTQADFDASGQVDVSDFNVWNSNKFQVADAIRGFSLNQVESLDEEEAFTHSVVDSIFAELT